MLSSATPTTPPPFKTWRPGWKQPTATRESNFVRSLNVGNEETICGFVQRNYPLGTVYGTIFLVATRGKVQSGKGCAPALSRSTDRWDLSITRSGSRLAPGPSPSMSTNYVLVSAKG